MKLGEVKFLTSAVKPPQYPEEGPPEAAFAGRSNVGKSSLMNKLLNRKNLVKVSSKPGRTQLINFFTVDGDRFRLVDLPGYGFAKVPPSVRAGWKKMVESYITGRPSLKAVVVILDVRRDPSEEDIMLLSWLASLGLGIIVAITKADKLSKNQAQSRLARLRPVLKPYDPTPTLCSAETGLGRQELWARLSEAFGYDSEAGDKNS